MGKNFEDIEHPYPDEQQQKDFAAGWARAAAEGEDYNPYPDESQDPDLPSIRDFLQHGAVHDRGWSYEYAEPWDDEEFENGNRVDSDTVEYWWPQEGESWFDAGCRWLGNIYYLLSDDYDVYCEWLEDEHYTNFRSGVLRAAFDDDGLAWREQLEEHDLDDRPWCRPWEWEEEPDWRPPRGGDVWDLDLYWDAGERWYRVHRDEIQQSVPLIV